MSKTDRTRPSAVRVLESPAFLEAYHRCAEHGQHNVANAVGECDLPPRPTGRAWAPGARYDETLCSWSPSHAFWRSADGGACRCPKCMGEDYEVPQRIKQRRHGKAVSHDAEREHFHGDTDDLSGLEMPWETAKRWAETYGGFEDEMARYAALRDLFVHDGDLPATAYVVDVITPYDDTPGIDNSVHFDDRPWHIEVLHNDGRRETMRLDYNPWVALINATPTNQMADQMETSLR
jgi:hypothetical protein